MANNTSGANPGASEYIYVVRRLWFGWVCDRVLRLYADLSNNFACTWTSCLSAALLDPSKQWRKFWAELKDNTLYFFKNQKTQHPDALSGYIEINSAGAVELKEAKRKDFQFTVRGSSNIFFLRASTETERDGWVEVLAAAGAAAEAAKVMKSTQSSEGGGPSAILPSRTSSHSRPLPPPPSGGPVVTISGGGRAEGPAVVQPGDDAFVVPAPDPADLFSRESWHFGRTSRNIAERVMDRHGSEGSFLIRASVLYTSPKVRRRLLAISRSESSHGDFSLTVQDEGIAKHYKVTQQAGVLVLSGCPGQTFADLGALVNYYVTASRGRTSPLDKWVVEKMDAAFSAPALTVPGLMLPGERVALEAEQLAKASPKPSRRRPPPPLPPP